MGLRWRFKRCFTSVVALEEDFIDGKEGDKEQALLGEEGSKGKACRQVKPVAFG